METEIVLDVKIEALEEGGFLATSSDLPGLVVQGRTRTETIELAQANARILMEFYLSENLPLPAAIRRLFKRKFRSINVGLNAPSGGGHFAVTNAHRLYCPAPPDVFQVFELPCRG
jgi:antitoxin HicB